MAVMLNDSQLTELCHALGWQGGTFHQVLAELRRTCEWNCDDDGIWYMQCDGDPWVFEVDGPHENGVKFCMRCSGRVIVKSGT
jgi:hypothetical protein